MDSTPTKEDYISGPKSINYINIYHFVLTMKKVI
jgi:hypothetical protein